MKDATRERAAITIFLRKLRRTPRGWQVNQHGELRDSYKHCPLEAVDRVLSPSISGQRDFNDIARRLKLPMSVKRAIMCAADDVIDRADCEGKYWKLRARMLKACGVTT